MQAKPTMHLASDKARIHGMTDTIEVLNGLDATSGDGPVQTNR